MFTLTVNGKPKASVLPTELNQPTSAFGKAWNNFLRELDSSGVIDSIQEAKIEIAGKTINLPVVVHA